MHCNIQISWINFAFVPFKLIANNTLGLRKKHPLARASRAAGPSNG